MIKLVRVITAGLAEVQSIPLSLSYPFEYTLAPQEFSLQDIRFKEMPFSREFAKPEREHILFILQNFASLLNTGKMPTEQFVQQSLISKTLEMRSILAESKISL
jgi:hypothetical protein